MVETMPRSRPRSRSAGRSGRRLQRSGRYRASSSGESDEEGGAPDESPHEDGSLVQISARAVAEGLLDVTDKENLSDLHSLQLKKTHDLIDKTYPHPVRLQIIREMNQIRKNQALLVMAWCRTTQNDMVVNLCLDYASKTAPDLKKPHLRQFDIQKYPDLAERMRSESNDPNCPKFIPEALWVQIKNVHRIAPLLRKIRIYLPGDTQTDFKIAFFHPNTMVFQDFKEPPPFGPGRLTKDPSKLGLGGGDPWTCRFVDERDFESKCIRFFTLEPEEMRLAKTSQVLKHLPDSFKECLYELANVIEAAIAEQRSVRIQFLIYHPNEDIVVHIYGNGHCEVQNAKWLTS